MNLNKAQLIGNVTRDPEVKVTPTNQTVANFSVATTRKWKQNGEPKEATEFHNLVAWGKLAEIIKQYVHKGDKLYVEGRLQTRSWDKPEGGKAYRTEIVVENMIMLGGKKPARDEVIEGAPTQAEAEDSGIDVSDIPF